MQDPAGKAIKAWAKEYEEAPFFFEQDWEHGRRLVGWSEQPDQIKNAFYTLLKLLPSTVGVLLKISVEKVGSKEFWSRFHGKIDRVQLENALQKNESYVFSDGMHQLCLRDLDTGHYFVLDDHGILFVYEPTVADREIFHSLGFEARYAEPLYSAFHYHREVDDSETIKAKFVEEAGLTKVNSDGKQ